MIEDRQEYIEAIFPLAVQDDINMLVVIYGNIKKM